MSEDKAINFTALMPAGAATDGRNCGNPPETEKGNFYYALRAYAAG